MADTKTIEKVKEELRKNLNPAIRGKNVDSVLEALAQGPAYLIENIEAIYDQLYIVTATGRYLDQRMADRNITRPDNVGLSDEIFREIGIEISNRKQVRDLILNLLRIMYGPEFTRATSDSKLLEPYALQDGDLLKIQFDDNSIVDVVFKASQFSNIAAAKAQEVADAITRSLRNQGASGTAVAVDNGSGFFVRIFSETDGPSSTVKILGGRAQNELQFNAIRPTSGDVSTQWTVEVQAGGVVRMTWTGGANPSVGKVKKGDYVNIYNTAAFSPENIGTFTITKVQGGTVNNAYVEFENPTGKTESTPILQGTVDGVLFFNPERQTINSKINYASIYQTESRLLEVFIPATTRVVRRERIGSAHLHDVGSSGTGNEGPYVYDLSKTYVIAGEEASTTSVIDTNSSRVINIDDSTPFPDSNGFLIFGFGTSKEEGPVPYIARPSSQTLLIDPSYRFKNIHEIGTNVALVAQNFPVNLKTDGTDFSFYVTDIVSGRVYAESLVNLVKATGINIVITILYPNDIGLSKWNTSDSDKFYVWGSDPS